LEEIEDSFVLDRDLDEPDSTGQTHEELKIKHLPTDLEEQLITLLKAVRKLSPDTIPDKQRRNDIVLSVMQRAFELRLAQYPTDVDSDSQLLSQVGSLSRFDMAVVVRRGEKLLLKEAVDLVRDQISESYSQANGEGPTAKKQRIG
jgi:hypothetical protein